MKHSAGGDVAVADAELEPRSAVIGEAFRKVPQQAVAEGVVMRVRAALPD